MDRLRENVVTTLTIIYLSLTTGQVHAKHHRVPADQCQAIYQTVRAKVRAGRVWGICHQ